MDATEPKYMTPEEVHNLELSQALLQANRNLVEVKKRDVEIAKLQAEIMQKNFELHQAKVQSLINAVRDEKAQVTKKREKIQGITDTLKKKYDLESFAGYDPISGEIAESQPERA